MGFESLKLIPKSTNIYINMADTKVRSGIMGLLMHAVCLEIGIFDVDRLYLSKLIKVGKGNCETEMPTMMLCFVMPKKKTQNLVRVFCLKM